ncbi:MAG: hypothetical protein RIS34_1338 [Pseudomonadota bacterium]|jgi:hypothetical protein
MKPAWISTLIWIAIALAAMVLAVVGPQESSVMGTVPSLRLSAQRTLALITFNKNHRQDADSWIQGLQLQNDPSINWVRMPVLKDPGDASIRDAMETRVRSRYPTELEHGNLLPVFTDRAAFIQSAGLKDIDHAYVVVIGRNGDVLARVAGQFNEAKAQALRETLTMQGY